MGSIRISVKSLKPESDSGKAGLARLLHREQWSHVMLQVTGDRKRFTETLITMEVVRGLMGWQLDDRIKSSPTSKSAA